ncbi:PEP-CTERM sorting domain-containing protein [Nostoc sp.]|uniref:PEP-CTERM sorting domain-containing protein n=1 Tax=Nostoc sp. TaxID=1180 RepID=UPI002FF814DE
MGTLTYSTVVSMKVIQSFQADADYGSFSVIPCPVPEPYTVGGSLVALGFGWWTKRKQAVASQKKPHKGIYL